MKNKILIIISFVLVSLIANYLSTSAVSLLQPYQGGTGIGSSTPANDLYVLTQVSSTPNLIYELRAVSGSGDTFTTTTINGLSTTDYTFVYGNTQTGGISTSSPGTITLATTSVNIGLNNGDSGSATGTKFYFNSDTSDNFVSITWSLGTAVDGTKTLTLTPVSGDIPLGFSKGGSGTSTNFSAGSVIFSNGTSLAEKNSQLFWNNTNNRLGIGTSTPSFALDVNSSSTFDLTNPLPLVVMMILFLD